jgi:hypothetical protein
MIEKKTQLTRPSQPTLIVRFANKKCVGSAAAAVAVLLLHQHDDDDGILLGHHLRARVENLHAFARSTRTSQHF